MTRSAAAVDVRTYVPEEGQDAQIVDFVRALEAAGRGAVQGRPALVGADGTRLELPDSLFQVLRQVAEALASGMGVTVAPMNALLTTQEAADFLGVARPTLVRILERGELAMEKPGRHRFVRLQDLLDFQARRRQQAAQALDDLVAVSEDVGLYEVSDGPAPVTR